MISRMIRGCTRVCGKTQGYIGLPIRDVELNDTVNGPQTPAMQTSWEPTPAELEALSRGGSVMITILGCVPPPMSVTVEEAE